jgi:peroxiredoxin (alkyl hydroperoxide reductase subunit C)
MSLIGKKAPFFISKAVKEGEIIENFSLQDLLGKYVVLFFYPLDFTFVCPTELHAFQERQQEFLARGAQVVGCSVDSCYAHLAWMNMPKEKGGIQGVCYPLIADLNKTIAKSYHVLDQNEEVAFRGLFILDPQGVIRHQTVNDLPIGRSVCEVLRVLDALIFHAAHGQVCPANWKAGEKAMLPTSKGVEVFFSRRDLFP